MSMMGGGAGNAMEVVFPCLIALSISWDKVSPSSLLTTKVCTQFPAATVAEAATEQGLTSNKMASNTGIARFIRGFIFGIRRCSERCARKCNVARCGRSNCHLQIVLTSKFSTQ